MVAAFPLNKNRAKLTATNFLRASSLCYFFCLCFIVNYKHNVQLACEFHFIFLANCSSGKWCFVSSFPSFLPSMQRGSSCIKWVLTKFADGFLWSSSKNYSYHRSRIVSITYKSRCGGYYSSCLIYHSFRN